MTHSIPPLRRTDSCTITGPNLSDDQKKQTEEKQTEKKTREATRVTFNRFAQVQYIPANQAGLDGQLPPVTFVSIPSTPSSSAETAAPLSPRSDFFERLRSSSKIDISAIKLEIAHLVEQIEDKPLFYFELAHILKDKGPNAVSLATKYLDVIKDQVPEESKNEIHSLLIQLTSKEIDRLHQLLGQETVREKKAPIFLELAKFRWRRGIGNDPKQCRVLLELIPKLTEDETLKSTAGALLKVVLLHPENGVSPQKF